ncbi:MAG: nitroreductase family protein [Bacillota bacterium]|nr:nitroreductase family protein [Bacillota bacterium]
METKKYSDLICERRSVRTFDGQGIDEKTRAKLPAFAGDCPNPYGISMEFRFLSAKAHNLKSQVISGTDDFVAVKLEKAPNFEVALGYSMEKFVLDAWSIGIGTTWIGGTMDRAAFERAMDLSEHEIMPCVSPIGHAAKRMSLLEVAMRKGVGADRRKAFRELFFDRDFDSPLTEAKASQLLKPLEMVRLAPSAVNKQPWRILVSDNLVHFYEKKGKNFVSESVGDMQKIDMGIALCHFELAAEEMGIETSFEPKDPQIAAPEGTEYIATYRIVR